MKINRQKKILLGSVFLFALLIYGGFFIQNQKKLAQQRFLANETKLYEKIKTEQIELPIPSEQSSETIKKNIELFIDFPLNTENQPIPQVKEYLEEFTAQIVDKELKQNATAKIILSANCTFIRDNLLQYSPVAEIYTWNKKDETWEKTRKKSEESFLLNTTQQKVFTLGDLFGNQSNLLFVHRLVRENLLQTSKNITDNLDNILSLPLFSSDEIRFDYTEKQVTLFFNQKIADQKDITLSYEKLGYVLNPDFVDQKYIQTASEKIIDPEKKYIALTFDDGPNPETTPKLLEILKEKKVPATFFVLGSEVEKNPTIVKKIAEDGHEIGNHSFSHPSLPTLSVEEIQTQIVQTEKAVYTATGSLPTFVRPPYGNIDLTSASLIDSPLIYWSVDSEDWKSKDAKKIHEQVMNTVKPQSIILMHDIQPATLEALPNLLTQLQKEGYEFVSVSDLLPTQLKPMNAYYSGVTSKEIE